MRQQRFGAQPDLRLSLPGVAGNYASTPDAAANKITGDMTVIALVAMTDWTPAADMRVLCKRNATTSYDFFVTTLGRPSFYDGSTTFNASASPTIADGAPLYLKWDVDVDNGAGGKTITFSTSPDGLTWAALGTPVSSGTAGALTDTTNILTVGAFSNGTTSPFGGKISSVKVLNGIGGALAVDFNPNLAALGATSFGGRTGETWTINSSGGTPAVIERAL